MSTYYTVAQERGGHWFGRPTGDPEFSIGINHLDGASLRYPDSGDAWRSRYGNSQRKWLSAVGEELRAWGFNAVGWVQEVVIISDHYHRHSRNFIREEYEWLGMPYCHMLPFTDSHQWEDEIRLPDVMHPDFEEWCDYVARDHCARLADDPNLIGYFYSDCPVFSHTRIHNTWRGTLLRPWLPRALARPDSPIDEVAERYYRVTRDAIRRYDPNHLILGDRYEANAPLPAQVIEAALPFVDVLSFQCFGTPEHIHETLAQYADRYHVPLLLADAAGRKGPPGFPPTDDRLQDVAHYRRTMELLLSIPQCIGYHLCGAVIRNRTRRHGLKDHTDEPIRWTVDGLREVNVWVEETVAERLSAG